MKIDLPPASWNVIGQALQVLQQQAAALLEEIAAQARAQEPPAPPDEPA